MFTYHNPRHIYMPFSPITHSLYSKTNTAIHPHSLYSMPSDISCMVCRSVYNHNYTVRDSIYTGRSLLYRYTIHSNNFSEVRTLLPRWLLHHSVCKIYTHLHFLPIDIRRFVVFLLLLTCFFLSSCTINTRSALLSSATVTRLISTTAVNTKIIVRL